MVIGSIGTYCTQYVDGCPTMNGCRFLDVTRTGIVMLGNPVRDINAGGYRVLELIFTRLEPTILRLGGPLYVTAMSDGFVRIGYDAPVGITNRSEAAGDTNVPSCTSFTVTEAGYVRVIPSCVRAVIVNGVATWNA
jgi:hypothetical protein